MLYTCHFTNTPQNATKPSLTHNLITVSDNLTFPWDTHLISLGSQTLNYLTILSFLTASCHVTLTIHLLLRLNLLGIDTSSHSILPNASSWHLTQHLPRQSPLLCCLPSRDRTFGLRLSFHRQLPFHIISFRTSQHLSATTFQQWSFTTWLPF